MTQPVPASPVAAVDDPAVDVASSVPVQSLRTTVRGVLSIVAPTTLVVALLYYFGWARTSSEAHTLALDDSLFGFSSQDYILRSISSMFWPVFIGTVALLPGSRSTPSSARGWTKVAGIGPDCGGRAS